MNPEQEAIYYLEEAIQRIKWNKGGAACWRIADALLLIGKAHPTAVGIATPTGRGAILKKIDYSNREKQQEIRDCMQNQAALDGGFGE